MTDGFRSIFLKCYIYRSSSDPQPSKSTKPLTRTAPILLHSRSQPSCASRVAESSTSSAKIPSTRVSSQAPEILTDWKIKKPLSRQHHEAMASPQEPKTKPTLTSEFELPPGWEFENSITHRLDAAIASPEQLLRTQKLSLGSQSPHRLRPPPTPPSLAASPESSFKPSTGVDSPLSNSGLSSMSSRDQGSPRRSGGGYSLSRIPGKDPTKLGNRPFLAPVTPRASLDTPIQNIGILDTPPELGSRSIDIGQ